LVTNPDKIETYCHCFCKCFGNDLTDEQFLFVVKRQVIDIPPDNNGSEKDKRILSSNKKSVALLKPVEGANI
jgi:hypothetical protein